MSVSNYQRWAFSVASEAMLIGSIGLAWLAMGGWITDELEKRLRKRLAYSADTGLHNLPDDEPLAGDGDEGGGDEDGGNKGGGDDGGGDDGGVEYITIWYDRRADTTSLSSSMSPATATTALTGSTTSPLSSATANATSLATSPGAVDPRCTSCDVSVLILAFFLGAFCE